MRLLTLFDPKLYMNRSCVSETLLQACYTDLRAFAWSEASQWSVYLQCYVWQESYTNMPFGQYWKAWLWDCVMNNVHHHLQISHLQVGKLPHDLMDRRVEITGPPDRKMVINALNSGASVFMADFEDSNAPSWFVSIPFTVYSLQLVWVSLHRSCLWCRLSLSLGISTGFMFRQYK